MAAAASSGEAHGRVGFSQESGDPHFDGSDLPHDEGGLSQLQSMGPVKASGGSDAHQPDGHAQRAQYARSDAPMDAAGSFEVALARIAAVHGHEVARLRQEMAALERHLSEARGLGGAKVVGQASSLQPTAAAAALHAKGPASPAREAARADVEHVESASSAWRMKNEASAASAMDVNHFISFQAHHCGSRHPHSGALGEDSDNRSLGTFKKIVASKKAVQKAAETVDKMTALRHKKVAHFGDISGLHHPMAGTETFSKAREARQSKDSAASHTENHGVVRAAVFRCLHHPAFDILCAVVILANAGLIGASVQWQAKHNEENKVLNANLDACNVFFIVELLLRMYAGGCYHFIRTDKWRGWNIFDSALVMTSLVEYVAIWTAGDDVSNLSVLNSLIQACKMLRIVRLFRVFRFFRELSDLALMVLDAGRSLVNAIVTLAIIIFVFACCFTSTATGYISQLPNGDDHVHKWFGTMDRTIYTLIQSTLGGVSWGEVTDQLLKLDIWSVTLFIFYLLFTILAVLNIITGVFVENAMNVAHSQRDFLVQKEMDLRERYVKDLRELYWRMDEDASGTVSLQEVLSYYEDAGVRSYFQALGLDMVDAERLFLLIDKDGSGDVDLTEFIDGCLRLKGSARSIDIFQLIHTCNRMESWLKELMGLFVGGSVSSQRSGRARHGGSSTAVAKRSRPFA